MSRGSAAETKAAAELRIDPALAVLEEEVSGEEEARLKRARLVSEVTALSEPQQQALIHTWECSMRVAGWALGARCMWVVQASNYFVMDALIRREISKENDTLTPHGQQLAQTLAELRLGITQQQRLDQIVAEREKILGEIRELIGRGVSERAQRDLGLFYAQCGCAATPLQSCSDCSELHRRGSLLPILRG